MKRRVAAYWLIPAQAEKELFLEIIRILSRQYQAPLFEPHLTLFAANIPEKAARASLAKIHFAPVRLNVREIDFSRAFTKTLFVRFESNPALRRLLRTLGRTAGSQVSSLPDPHLSLIYKKLPASVKKELASTIRLPLGKVTFDSVKLTNCIAPTHTAREVENWRTIATKRLSG